LLYHLQYLPLIFTVLSAAVVLKLVPVMVTTVPAGPDTGLMAVTVGGIGIATGGFFLQPVLNKRQLRMVINKAADLFI
jgi:hypothetical protein